VGEENFKGETFLGGWVWEERELVEAVMGKDINWAEVDKTPIVSGLPLC
jgi:hypothetical protein